LPPFNQQKYVGFINDAIHDGLLDYPPDDQGNTYSDWKWQDQGHPESVPERDARYVFASAPVASPGDEKGLGSVR
jgi:hypothetical protein